MKVHYICHSCFLVETKMCYYLFDYYKGELPPLNTEKPIMVFSSHFHSDHYNPAVFTILREQGMKDIRAVLSKDISFKKYPDNITATTVTFHQTYPLDFDTNAETLLSTDEGVAYLITCPEGSIYHAGDLNDWVWEEETTEYNKQMTGMYRHEIDLIAGRNIDIAFLPLDPRQEKDYSAGILYFLKKVNVKKVFPMHYWEKPEIIDKFLSEHPEYASVIENTENYL